VNPNIICVTWYRPEPGGGLGRQAGPGPVQTICTDVFLTACRTPARVTLKRLRRPSAREEGNSQDNLAPAVLNAFSQKEHRLQSCGDLKVTALLLELIYQTLLLAIVSGN
jgi:hypothetical protein